MHIKNYKIADITVEVRSDLPITEHTFHPKFKAFETKSTAGEMVVIHHHFSGIPETPVDRDNPVHLHPPWAIFENKNQFIYEWIKPNPPFENIGLKVIAKEDHSHLDIFHDDNDEKLFNEGSLHSLAMFPTDQIWLGRVLAHRNGCIIHSLGAIRNNHGYLFVGHSDAGKSTMAKMLMKDAVILCDDRNVIRKMENRYNAYGTWSHGDVPLVSSSSAPLRAIFFLKQSKDSRILAVEENSTIIRSLLACLIRPLGTDEWWHQSIDFIIDVAKNIPCLTLEFNKSGDIVDVLNDFTSDKR